MNTLTSTARRVFKTVALELLIQALGRYAVEFGQVGVNNNLLSSNQENAMLAEPDNPLDFAEQILWLIGHPVEAETIAVAGCLWTSGTLSHRDATRRLGLFLNDCIHSRINEA